MTLSYLYKPASTQLDANGNGVASAGPDSNQYWLPTSIHIGTRNAFNPYPACNLYVGPPELLDYSSLVDFTFAGNNDTSSVVSGLVVSPGQSISANFLGGTPGDTSFMSITGISSDKPPTHEILPSIGGARFSNLGVPTPYQNSNRRPVAINTMTIGNGATVVILPAIPGRQYRLWTVYSAGLFQPQAGTCQFFSGGILFAISPSNIVGTPANAYTVQSQLMQFQGALLDVGTDLSMQNVSGAAQYFVGYVSYSY